MADNFSSRFGNNFAFEGIGNFNGNSASKNVKLKPTSTQIAYNKAMEEAKESQIKKAVSEVAGEHLDDIPLTGKDIYGPYYDEAKKLHEENPNWYPNPDESYIVKDDELKFVRDEYNSMVSTGELEKGHHRQGLAFGGENVDTNIQFTGESTIKSEKLEDLDLEFYHTQGYGKKNAKILKIHQTENGIFVFGNNPNHTEVTTFQNKVLKWQRDNGLS